MNVFTKKLNIILVIILLLTITIIPNVAFCGDSDSKEKTTKELTKAFRADGWYSLTFYSSGQDTVSIRHAEIKQNNKLTEGQLVSAVGSILEPNVVSKLKKSGFKKGILIDGKGRKYPFEISTKYYVEQQAFLKKLSGGK
jgi:hypothetical protein